MNMLNRFENAKKPDLAVDVQVVLNNDFNFEMDGGSASCLKMYSLHSWIISMNS